jgi:uncharacterized protein YjbI with pentapeptide repeats
VLRIEPARMGYRRYWVATGELRDARFELPGEPSQVKFTQATLVNVDFSGQTFESFSVHASTLEGCDFTSTSFEQLSLAATFHGGDQWDRRYWPQTVYRGCAFERTRFAEHTFWGNARMERCRFDRSRMRSMIFTQQVEFVECTFLGKIHGVNFWGRPTQHQAALGRTTNEFRGNDFTGARLTGVSFRHIDLRSQLFPGLPDYAVLDRMATRTAAALVTTAAWGDPAVARDAEFSLRFIANSAEEHGDGWALVSPDSFGDLPPERRQELFDLLVNYSDE